MTSSNTKNREIPLEKNRGPGEKTHPVDPEVATPPKTPRKYTKSFKSRLEEKNQERHSNENMVDSLKLNQLSRPVINRIIKMAGDVDWWTKTGLGEIINASKIVCVNLEHEDIYKEDRDVIKKLVSMWSSWLR